jgi:hypothetical protein
MSGMGMIFTNSGKHAGKQASRNIQAPIQAPIQAQPRSFHSITNASGAGSNRGVRTMDLGNLKNSKSCGSCGH